MPVVRKLTQEEVEALANKTVSLRKKAAAFYDELLQDCVDGDEVELELEVHERRLTVISRLKTAAARRSPAMQIAFRRTRDPMLLRFRVLPVTQGQAGALNEGLKADFDDEDTQPPFDYMAFDRSRPMRYQSGNGRPAHRSHGFARYSQQQQRSGEYGRAKQRRRW